MSVGSRVTLDPTGTESELQKLRMDYQILQLEKELVAKKLEVSMNGMPKKHMPHEGRRVRKSVDSEVELLVTKETAGYASRPPVDLWSVDVKEPEMDSMSGRVGIVGSTPLRGGSAAQFSPTELTPIAKEPPTHTPVDELALFLSGQSVAEHSSRSRNPFLEEGEMAPKKSSSELLSCATHLVEVTQSSSSAVKDHNSVRPQPPKSEVPDVKDDTDQKDLLER